MNRDKIIALFKSQNWYSLWVERFKENNLGSYTDYLSSERMKEYINWAFTWDCTPEGEEYWGDIDDEWRGIVLSNEGE